jgi:hypothetical protein
MYANSLPAVPVNSNSCHSITVRLRAADVQATLTSAAIMVHHKAFHEEDEVVLHLLSVVVEDVVASSRMVLKTALHQYSNPTMLYHHLQT